MALLMRSARIRTTLCVLAVAAAAGLISFRSMYEPDLWWHLAQGRETAAGHLVRTNLFSAGYAGYPQAYTSWLFDLGAYLLWTRGGSAAIQAAQALLIAATLWLTGLACRARASSAATLAVCAFGWLILEPRAIPRPHLFSFAGMAACAWLVERARASRSARPLFWVLLAAAYALFLATFRVDHPFNKFEGFLRNEMLSAVVSSVYWKTVFFLFAAGGLAALYVTRLRRPSLYLVYPLALATLLPLRLIEHRYGLPAFVMLLVCREDDPPAVEYAGVALGALLSAAAVYVLARGLWLL